MLDLRGSAVFAACKQRWRMFLFVQLETKLPSWAVGMIACFLDIVLDSDKDVTCPLPSSSVIERPAERSVIDVISHPEDAAQIDPAEAAQLVRIQEADFVERNLGAAAWADEEAREPIFLCTFNRHPLAFQQVLEHGVALRSCRDSLDSMGYAWALPSGTKVFVHPSQYDQVIQRLPPSLGHRSIVVAQSLEHLLEQDLATIESHSGSFHGAWAKARELLTSHADIFLEPPIRLDDARDEPLAVPPYQVRVERTFLVCADLAPPQRNVTTVVQSAISESDPDQRHNPRRALAQDI